MGGTCCSNEVSKEVGNLDPQLLRRESDCFTIEQSVTETVTKNQGNLRLFTEQLLDIFQITNNNQKVLDILQNSEDFDWSKT